MAPLRSKRTTWSEGSRPCPAAARRENATRAVAQRPSYAGNPGSLQRVMHKRLPHQRDPLGVQRSPQHEDQFFCGLATLLDVRPTKESASVQVIRESGALIAVHRPIQECCGQQGVVVTSDLTLCHPKLDELDRPVWVLTPQIPIDSAL